MSNSFQDQFDIEALRTKEGDSEAERRFNLYKSLDPFPEIIPALLNSADIYDYVRVTGMICPFDPDPKKLKSASYAVPILGDYIYWDDKDNDEWKWKWKKLEKNDEFTLEANSIAFVSIEPKFRIPDYIALRFNLKITHIHRGILLGTGPLIDPGYVGKLLIPLHNLTTNKYTFRGGEDLIWIEFTKLSNNHRWSNTNTSYKKFIRIGTLIKYNSTPTIKRIGQYREFPQGKSLDDVKKFLTNSKVSEGRPIRSSLPDIIVKADKSVQEAKKSAEKSAKKSEDAANTAKSIGRNITIGGILGAIIAVVTLLVTIILPLNSVVQDSINYVKNTNDVKKEYEEKINELENVQEQYKEKINNLEIEIQSLRKDIEEINQQSSANSLQNVSDRTEGE